MSALSLLPGYFLSATQLLKRRFAVGALLSLDLVRVYRKFPHELLNIRVADAQPPRHGTLRPLSGPTICEPLPHKASD
jgi:hypothetical protein